VDLRLFADFVVPGGDLENPHAVLTPKTHDKLFDEGGFDGADWIVLLISARDHGPPGEEIVVVVFETLRGFSVEDDDIGEEAAFDVGLGAGDATFGGDGPVRFGAVQARGSGVKFRKHFHAEYTWGWVGLFIKLLIFLRKIAVTEKGLLGFAAPGVGERQDFDRRGIE
jgi:hypothetical protein